MVTGVFAWSSFSGACKTAERLDNCGHKRRMIFQTHLCNHRETVLGRYAARPPPNFDILMGWETGGQRWPDFPSRDGPDCFPMEQA